MRYDGYRIDSLVAKGGMGVIYDARENAHDRWVALNVIAPEFAKNPADRFATAGDFAKSLCLA